MGLFPRYKRIAQRLPVPYRDDLVAVPSARLDGLLRQMTVDVAHGYETANLGSLMMDHLGLALPLLSSQRLADLSEEEIKVGFVAAKLGWCARAVECFRFETARERDPDMLAAFTRCAARTVEQGSPVEGTLAEFAAAMVRAESLRPDYEEHGSLWSVPGMGGELRLDLADRLLHGITSRAVGSADMLRTWKYGYYLRFVHEAVVDDHEWAKMMGQQYRA